jgi:hypothetical protein
MTQYVVRDEEVVGSNPATPTVFAPLRGHVLAIEDVALDHLTLV